MNVAGEVILKPGKERSLMRRHPWVYDTAVARVTGKPGSGATVAVRAADGAWLAWAAYSPTSTLRARCWSFVEGESIDADWFAARVRAAVGRRAHLAAVTTAQRLVFGEADQLPGLVVDRYADQLVIQCQAAGVEAWREALLDALVGATGCGNVYDRSDSATRKREGLEASHGVARGAEPPERIEVHEHGVRYGVDVRRGHKTGYYVDQRDNRALVRQLAQRMAEAGRAPRVLNCFCYTGGFSLAAAAGGAAQVLSIDSSAEALAQAADNAQRNGQGPQHDWRNADVFEALRALKAERGAESFDLIVLDPPKFASTHHHVDRAARAYK
ncbi:MAG: class I SAM-dependent rRNA methyltransferase, partial [Burkholderiaceae bacterium]|nr:class I SAM-dependent rRNA methyltransferase [Burkholderiaceae bacterium]